MADFKIYSPTAGDHITPAVGKIKLGSSDVSKIYQGSTLVWPVEYTIDFFFSNTAYSAGYQPQYPQTWWDYASELTVTVDGIYSSYTGGTYSQYHGNITGGVSENHTYTFRAGDTVTIYFYGYVTEGTKEYGNYFVDTDSNNDSTAYNNWVTYNSGNSYSNTFTMPSENLSCTIDMGNYFD